LPQARIVLDHFHLVMLANKMLTDVRQRVQHEQQGRRGMKVDPAWAHRRLLLRAGNELGPKALARLKTVFDTDDPTNEISAAWGIKELPCSDAASPWPERVQQARDLDSSDPVPGGLRGRGHARGDPARGHDREVVARDRSLPDHGRD
jgi:transposase